MTEQEKLRLCLIFVTFAAVLSAIGSGFVVLTQAVFFKRLVKGKVFSYLLFFAAACDFIVSLANALGFPHNDSAYCSIQGGLIFFFARSTVWWVLCMSFQLYALIIFGKGFRINHIKYLHLICWSSNLIIELVPLSHNHYGEDDELSTTVVCDIRFGDDAVSIQYGSTFDTVGYFAPLMLAMLVMSYFSFAVFRKWSNFKDASLIAKYPLIKSATECLILYPFFLVVCFLPYCAFRLYDIYSTNVQGLNVSYSPFTRELVYDALNACATLYGFLLACIFVSKSKDARYYWLVLLGCTTLPLSSQKEEGSEVGGDGEEEETARTSLGDGASSVFSRIDNAKQQLALHYEHELFFSVITDEELERESVSMQSESISEANVSQNDRNSLHRQSEIELGKAEV